MRPRTLLAALLLLFVAAGLAWVGVRASRKPPVIGPPASTGPGAVAPAAAGNRVVAYYFHGRVRCVSCNRIEALSKKVIGEAFARELGDGRLAQVVVDVDQAGNGHFVKEYGLAGSAVVLVDGRAGGGGRYKNLEEVWTRLDDEAAFSRYIRENVASFLAGSPK